MTSITWILASGQLQSIDLDATVRQAHESSATATEHTVERGANVSDHVRANLDRITLEVVVSNQPITVPKTQMDGIGRAAGGLEIVDGFTGITLAQANVLVFDSDFDRVRTIYDLLLDLKSSGEIVSIITTLREYEDMVLLRVSPVREAATGDALVATVEARQINVVDSEVVQAPEPVQTRDAAPTNRGRQNTSVSTNQRDSSILADLAEAAFGI